MPERHGKRWPELDAFVAEAVRLLATDGPESFPRCVEPLRRLARSGFARAFVDWTLRAAMDPLGNGPEEIGDTELTLARGERFSLNLVGLEAGPRTVADQIEGLAHHLALAVVGPGSLAIERYRLTPPYRFEVLDRSRRLEGPSAETLGAGDAGFFKAGEDVMRIRRSPSVAVALLLRSELIHRVRWVYDPVTLSPCLAVAGDPRSSRLEFACRIVAKLGEPSDVPALESLVTHPDHFVRWTALQSIMHLDTGRGCALMRDALEDVHPHVRSAASRFFRDTVAR